MVNNTSESKKRTKRDWLLRHFQSEVSHFVNGRQFFQIDNLYEPLFCADLYFG